MSDRITKILEILAAHQRIKVTTLAEMLDVSQVTIRKDLDALERQSLIRRIHGYASLDGADDLSKRMVCNYSVKRRIAKSAAEKVEEGETIMLESGSCCAFLAEELALAKKDVTIITNSVFIANYVRNKPPVKIILLGGYYQPDSQVLVGPMTIKCGEDFFSDKYFIGADGFKPQFGFTGRDYMRVQTAAELAKFAKNVFVLTESDKFQRQGVLSLLKLDMVTGVYTDDRIPSDAETILLKNKIILEKVSSKET